MVVHVVEEVEADPADTLLPHHGLVQYPGQDVRDYGTESVKQFYEK